MSLCSWRQVLLLVVVVVAVNCVVGQTRLGETGSGSCKCESIKWVKGSKGTHVPEGAVYAGEDRVFDGPVYVARAEHNNKVLPGKFVRNWEKVAIVEYGKSIGKTEFEILTSSTTLRWISKPATGVLPKGAVLAGYEDDYSALFVCRALHNGYYIPGELVAGNSSCNVENYQQVYQYDDYQVLVA